MMEEIQNKPTYWDIYYKEYYEKNKDSIKEKARQYKEINKEKLKEYHKKYNEAHRERINEKMKQKTYCEVCKKEVTKMNRHIASQRHLSKIGQ